MGVAKIRTMKGEGTIGKCEGVYRRVNTLPNIRTLYTRDMKVVLGQTFFVTHKTSWREHNAQPTKRINQPAFIDSEGESGYENYGGH